MIPSKLELKNFICYPDAVQTISFDDYSMICLSGKNGNGKSALLDAITWVLWGQARKISGVSKADEGLLRLGQKRMMVSLEFQLGTARYRVRREYAKTYGKPYAALDFEVFNDQTKSFVSLTDKTITATQAKIEQYIGLDFDTFINSAFLKQGQSNEFSKKTAKERKQILTNILGLDKYTKLQKLALEYVRKNSEEKRLLEKIQEQRNVELTQESILQETYKQEKTALQSTNQSIQEYLVKLNDYEQQRKQQEEQKKKYEEKRKDSLTLTEKKLHLEQELQSLIHIWKETLYQTNALPDIKLIEQQHNMLLLEEKALREAHQKTLQLQTTILSAQERYQKQLLTLRNDHERSCYQLEHAYAKHELEFKQTKDLISKKTELMNNGHATIKKLEANLEIFKKKTAPYQQLTSSLSHEKQQFEKRRARYQTWVQHGNRLKTELLELQQKKQIIHDSNKPSCPLCEQSLDAQQKQSINQQLNTHGNFFMHQLNRLKKMVPALKEILVQQHKTLEQHTSTVQELEKLLLQEKELDMHIQNQQKEIIILKEELVTLETTHKKLVATLTDLKTNYQIAKKLLLQIETDEHLKTITIEIKQLEQKKVALNFNEKKQEQIQQKLQVTHQQLQGYQHFRFHLERQPERRVAIRQHLALLKGIKVQLTSLHEQLIAMQSNLSDTIVLEKEISALTEQKNHLTAFKDTLLQRIGSAENALQRIAQLKTAHASSKSVIATFDQEIEQYQILAHTFSKDGIQALLIEEVIPEIESEANGILAKLTNNQSQIFVESLRDLKSGGVKETLDIKIADNIGIRPYEMFSGGEAFRIDFALRIAISKLLARRAGTSLQTLIIDEGFGSQDEDGLARMMDALHAIQHDFSKIIIVSHLAEFKDNFPVHFVVEKGSGGSIIHVEERG